MDHATLREYAERLDATGLRLARLAKDPAYSGDRYAYQSVPWDGALVRIAAAFGWSVIDERTAVDPAQLRLEP